MVIILTRIPNKLKNIYEKKKKKKTQATRYVKDLKISGILVSFLSPRLTHCIHLSLSFEHKSTKHMSVLHHDQFYHGFLY